MSLKISNLSKRIEDNRILRDVSFEVSDGEIFGIIGADEAEKSALLQLIANAKTSNSNEISFGENNPADTNVTVFPSPEEKNLWQKIFPAKENNSVNELEKFKTDFENALKNSAKTLLLDNPFSCLHENLRDELRKSLKSAVKEKNLTVVFFTNNSEEVFAVCDKAGVLNKGETVQTGTPKELYEKPKSVAVAAALGRSNFIKAMRVSFTNQNFQEFQTLEGEHRLQTDKSEKSTLGAINSPITLAIRPEHISISFGASFPEDNLLKAKISDVQYRGATTGIMLDANGLILEVLVLRLVGLKIGDECMVGMPPDRIQILKD
jgi:spermidine/putrescine transport system ATP-binding protein